MSAGSRASETRKTRRTLDFSGKTEASARLEKKREKRSNGKWKKRVYAKKERLLNIIINDIKSRAIASILSVMLHSLLNLCIPIYTLCRFINHEAKL